ncbi:MAG: menaquinone biosynthesis protein [Aquificaceae bacterium]|nr:menaquinone biosynthesis protein [Aquificaceae bacterium]
MLKIGKVGYLNALPLFYLWNASNVVFVEGHPSELVDLLRKGEIQAGIVSSVEYIVHKENYRLVPSVCISSLEKACSVLLFSKRPLEKVRHLYLTPASLTSRVLTLYLLERLHHNSPKVVEDRDMADALMLIGDEALKEKESGRWRYVYDLGEQWFSLHRLPFVFALFLIRRDAPEGLESFIAEQCSRSKSQFFKDLLGCKVNIEGYGKDFLKDYFISCLDYTLDARSQESLSLFKEILIKSGLLLNLRR